MNSKLSQKGHRNEQQTTAATYIIAAQYVCASVLALVVLVVGVVMLIQARNTGAASSQ